MSVWHDDMELRDPEPFHRPETNIWFRLTNRLLPPPPPDHVILGYGDLRRLIKRWHYLLGIPMLVLFLAITVGEARLWKPLTYSPLTFLLFGLLWLWDHIGWPGIVVWVVGCWALWMALRKWHRRWLRRHGMGRRFASVNSVGLLNTMAVVEEQWFREGAENWSGRQRFMSCFGFGVAHMANLFYAFSTILPLSLGGYLFMRVYLHEYRKTGSRSHAILAAALVHRVYNRVALFSALISVPYLFLAIYFHLPTLTA